MNDHDWTYYLDEGTPPVLFRKYALLAHRWDRERHQWIEIDHMYLPNRLRGGDVDLDEISTSRAESIMKGTDFCMLASCYDRCEPRVLGDPCRV